MSIHMCLYIGCTRAADRPESTLDLASVPNSAAAEAVQGACKRLSGSTALGDRVAAILHGRDADELTLMVFDFDKTLTTGFSGPGTTPLQRVRGGQHTIDGLRKAAAAGVAMRICTARSATKRTLETLVTQLDRRMGLRVDDVSGHADGERRGPVSMCR